jgi:hypothetical protein
MQRLEVSGAVRQLKGPLGVKWLKVLIERLFKKIEIATVTPIGS